MEAVETQEVTTVAQEAPQEVVKTTTKVGPQVVKTEPAQRVYEKKKAIFRMYQIIWYILGIIEALLVFRIVLRMIGANPYSGFTTFIYAVSAPLAIPFSGIVPATVSGSSVIEWSSMIAIFVYAVFSYGIIYLFQILKPVTPGEVSQTVDNP